MCTATVYAVASYLEGELFLVYVCIQLLTRHRYRKGGFFLHKTSDVTYHAPSAKPYIYLLQVPWFYHHPEGSNSRLNRPIGWVSSIST